MKVNNKILVHAIAKELTFCFTIQHVPLSVEVETRNPKKKKTKNKTYFATIEWKGIFDLKYFQAKYVILVLIFPFMEIH